MRIGITHGDYNGVGYEIICKALADERMPEVFTPVLYGIPELAEKCAREFQLELPKIKVVKDASEAEEGCLNIVDLGLRNVVVNPGKVTPASGRAAVIAMERCVKDALDGKIDAVVTAPISKEAVQSDAFKFTGHTEFFAERTNSKARMILFDEFLRVALLTTHVPISRVANSVTVENVTEAVKELAASLKLDFNVEYPKIAIFSLNPHCGDGGLIGDEEQTVITPVIESLGEEVMAFGPYAADGFFAAGAWTRFDGILAMYHDQGLAPFKALSGDRGVNFTAGLPFVRTSPDHGTAYDIAWKGLANPDSMRQALYAAVDLTNNRRHNLEAAENPLKIKENTHREGNKE